MTVPSVAPTVARAGTGAPPVAAAEPYDFRRPNRLPRERLRILEAIHDRFATAFEAWMTARARRPVTLTVTRVEQCTFGDFTRGLATPCAAFGFDLKDADGQRGVVDVDHALAYLLVDRLFGGTAEPAIPGRALTPIERLTVRTFIERVLATLGDAWQDHLRLAFELTTFESAPDMVQVLRRDDPVLVTAFAFAFDDSTSSLTVCLPFAAVETFFSSGDDRRVAERVVPPAERAANREVAERSLRRSTVDVVARFPAVDVPLRQLVGLGPGQVLAIGLPTQTPLTVLVSGKPRFRAAPGRIRNNVAVRLLDADESLTDEASFAT